MPPRNIGARRASCAPQLMSPPERRLSVDSRTYELVGPDSSAVLLNSAFKNSCLEEIYSCSDEITLYMLTVLQLVTNFMDFTDEM